MSATPGNPLGHWIDSVLQDLRFSLRMWVRNPGFTLSATVTLALGIGATTAAFSVVNAVVMRPLRFPDPDHLMAILTTYQGRGGSTVAPGVFLDWRARSSSFESIAGAAPAVLAWTGRDQARFVPSARASEGFFASIGVKPLAGRLFTAEDDRFGGPNVALIDAGFARRELGGLQVLGQALVLDDRPTVIVGVLPPGIRFANFDPPEIWVPLAANPNARTGGHVVAIGKLRRGVTRAAAQSEMNAVMRGIATEHIEDSRTGVLLKPLQDWMVGDLRTTFFALLGATVCLLLIGCANLANLLLARASARRAEMAMRAALGASRTRLLRQALVESLILALFGGALGVAICAACVRAVPSIEAFRIPRVNEIAIDLPVLLAAAVITILSAILFGLAPAFGAWRQSLSLQQAGSQRTGASAHFRNALVVAQLALALILLSGAGLMINSLVRLLTIDLGFERSHVVTAESFLPRNRYEGQRALDFYRRFAGEIRQLPGVREVAIADYRPLRGGLFSYQLHAGAVSERKEAQARHVDANYLRVLEIPLLAGRDFQPTDETRTPIPVLINQLTARALFGERSPLGQRITTPRRGRSEFEVIGVVGEVRQFDLATAPGLQIYLPVTYAFWHTVLARTERPGADLRAAIQGIAKRMDAAVPLAEVTSMDERFSAEVAKPRFYVLLLGGFAAIALTLAAIGIYGVMSFNVARRTREFGIRMALGANRWDIYSQVLSLATRLTIVGAILGAAGSLALTRLLATLLYGVNPGDPMTVTLAAVFLAAIAIAAGCIAARRATQVDPSAALRCD